MGTPSIVVSVGVGAIAGALLYRWWHAGALERERIQMRDLGKARKAENLDACAVSVAATSDRSFPMNRHDTALLLIDMQTDFLSSDGRVGKFYEAERVGRMQKAIDASAELLSACRAAGLTIAHSRSHRYGTQVLPELVSPLDETYDLHPRSCAVGIDLMHMPQMVTL